MGKHAVSSRQWRRWSTAGATAALVWAILPGTAQAVPVSATDWASLSAAVSAGRNVVLDADITHSGNTLAVPGTDPEIVDLNGHSLTLTGAAAAASVPAGGSLILKDLTGTATASFNGGAGHAGIELAATATLTVRGGLTTSITATGGTGGAGIGGATGAPGGTFDARQGIITATGGTGAAGIGGGAGGDAGTLNVAQGQVTGQAGPGGGAGIGGGTGGAGGPVSIADGFVTGRGTGAGSGVGAGAGGSVTGTAVTVAADGVLEVRGQQGVSLGSLTNAGLVRIVGSSLLTVPAGVTVENSGLIRLFGTINGPGTVHNTGTILPTPIGTNSLVTGDGQGPAGTALLVSVHNYTIQFTTDGQGGVAPATMHVYAKDIATAKQTLPAVPPGTGVTCAAGWFTSATGGTQVLDTTLLSTVADTGPSNLLLHRHCAAIQHTVTFDAQGGSPTPAAETVPDGGHATEPATAPTKAGNTFAGWFTAATGGTSWNFATDTVTADLTLYAHYTAVTTTTPTSPPPSSSTGSHTTAPSGPTTTSFSSGTGGTSLASTGADSQSGLTMALMLLVGGGALLLAGRRRRPGYARRH